MNKYSVLIDLDRLKDLNTGLGQVALYFGKTIKYYIIYFSCVLILNLRHFFLSKLVN